MSEYRLDRLLNTLPQKGTVTWIGLRPERRAPIELVDEVMADTEKGLIGDRYAGRTGKRHVTLIQEEHLPVIASVLGRDEVDPKLLRRNIVVKGMNLLALKNKTFRVGDALLKYTGLCHPCSFMEETFGEGGYNAVRGHGGITAQVLEGGLMRLNDEVTMADVIDANEKAET